MGTGNEWGQFQFLATPTYNGATALIARSHARADALNLTGITDGVTAANTASCTYSPANRLQLAAGPWGSKTFAYDGVGNRLSEATTPVSGLASTDTLTYAAGNNRVVNVVRGAQTVRSLTYDNAGSN